MKTRITKPILPAKIRIDGTMSLQNFFKRHQKKINILEFEYLHPDPDDPLPITKLTSCLLKVSKKSHLFHGLRFHKCISSDIPAEDQPKLQSILRRLSSSKFLSLCIDDFTTLNTYTKLLFHLRHLTKFNLLVRTYIEEGADLQQNTRSIYSLLSTFKKMKRLEVLKIMIDAQYSDSLKSFLDFNYYPQDLRKLTIQWRQYGTLDSSSFSAHQKISLSNLHSLETLNLYVPIQADVLQRGLASLPNPHKLRTINVEPYEDFSDPIERSVAILESVQPFRDLTEMTLGLTYQPEFIQALGKVFRDSPLIKLCLHVAIHKSGDLKSLSRVLRGAKKLESLTLRIRNTQAISFDKKDYLHDFFGDLAEHEQIRKLKIYFTLMFQPDRSKKTPEFISGLARCVGHLKYLDQLSFRFRQADVEGELPELLQALTQKKNQLVKLRMNFGREKIQKDSLNKLFELIQQMNVLEKLSLEEIFFENSSIFEAFVSSIGTLDHLKSLKINKMDGKVRKAFISLMIRSVAAQRGFKKVLCTSYIQQRGDEAVKLKESNRVDLKGVVKGNPEIESVYAPFDIYTTDDELSLCKWT